MTVEELLSMKLSFFYALTEDEQQELVETVEEIVLISQVFGQH